MRTFDELEALFQENPIPAIGSGSVHLIVLRRAAGDHETPRRVRVDVAEGVVGDRWALGTRNVDSQVTLMHRRVVEILCDAGQPPHLPGDNFLVDIDLGEAALPVGARVRVGAALLEISAKPHTGCKKFAARFGQDALRWVNWHEHRDRRLRGVNCRIVESGEVTVGDLVEHG